MTTISPIQERAVHLLLSGSTVAAAARELGIDRTTIYTWRKNPHFTSACQQARKLHSDFLADSLQDLASTALDTLREILVAKDAPAAVRLRAAQTVLSAANNQRPSTASAVQPDSTEFDTFPSSQAEIRLDEPENLTSGTFRRETPKVGRNEPCSCGSGLKHKRCCGGIGPRIQVVATGSAK